MADDEVRAFLMTGTRTGKLATVRADGRPHVAPIWFVVDDDGSLVFNTGAESQKGKALRRDPRAALAVDDETPPYAFVTIEGTVTLSEDVEAMLPWATRIAARYVGDEQAEAFGRRNAAPGELLVRLTPTNVVGYFDLTE
jgi:PPOX class probable F420-dependent enzyme